MGSKILFLGTAGDSLTWGKQLRGSAGIVISHNDIQMHINPGPGTLVRCKEYSIHPRNTDVILVTTNTLLASNDVNALVEAMTNGGLDSKGVLLCNQEVLEGSEKIQPAISQVQKEQLERIISLRVDDKVGINDIDIYPTKTQSNALGFRIATDSFTLSYVGESIFSKEIAKAHEGSEIMIFSMNKSSGSDVISYVNHIKPRLAIITDFGIKMLETDILTQVRIIQKETGIQTVAAKDGLAINPQSYSALVRQQKLL